MTDLTSIHTTTARFRELHREGCFVLPNPWDVGSAVLLAQLGFQALASSSAGFAFSRALPDAAWAVPREAMLAHIAELVNATSLPVSADFESGYAHAPEGVFEGVQLCVATGVAGLSIEDATGDKAAPLYERTLAVERIRAARSAIDASGRGSVLTARCEAFLVDSREPRATVLERLVSYADAGADCLFAPGIYDLTLIRELVRAVSPKPLNVLVGRHVPGLTVATLAEVGVRRVSLGSALARAAWGGFMRAARSLAEHGTFEPLEQATPFAELNELFLARRP